MLSEKCIDDTSNGFCGKLMFFSFPYSYVFNTKVVTVNADLGCHRLVLFSLWNAVGHSDDRIFCIKLAWFRT